MKKNLTLLFFMFAFFTNAMAWEPVLVEKHWFSFYEYDEPWLKTETGIHYGWDANGYLLSLKGAFRYDDDDQDGVDWDSEKWCTTTYYSILNHTPRFSVDNTDAWKIGRLESHWAYQSYGLQNKTETAQNFSIHNLEVGDTIIFEYYRANGDADGQVTLSSGSLQNVSTGGVIRGTDDYVCNAEGNITFSCPKNMLLRSVTIKLKKYVTAETEISEIAESERTNYEGATGYRFTIKSAGVLEDRRCAVPYMTMRIGDAENYNDLVYVRNLGTANEYGEQFGAGCIISDKDDLDVSKLSNHYAKLNNGDGQAITNLMLPGKEWTVFKAERAPEGYEGNTWDGDIFNSIYPIYGTYYYFFPEVDGYLNVRFYCEGNKEHMPLWYKQNGNEFIAVENQPTLTYATGGGDHGDNSNYNGFYEDQNYYEYRVKVEKGGVYYLCSNPTLLHQQRPVVRLMSYAFMPLFHLDPLWYVANDNEKASKTVNSASTLNQDFTVNGTKNIITNVKCLGNIYSAEPYFVADATNNKAYLNFKNIVYKSTALSDPTLNDGGAVVVTVECEEGLAKFVLTVPYSAEKAVASTDANNHLLRVMDTDATRNLNGKQVKKWDFFSNIYAVGQYSDEESQLYNEIHKADGLTADWVNTYMNLQAGTEPIFKSVYDMEGDNADMLVETEGLVFFTDANHLGIYNENNPSTDSFQDRYIGIIGDGEFWVPGLHEGDLIVLKMGRYGDDPHIQVENVQDAVGNGISGDYVFGGSHKLEDGQDQSIPYGEYHFISTGGHFKVKVTDATTLLKLYSIVIYRNSINEDKIISENEVLGTNREILYTDIDGGNAKEMKINLHYWGLGETQVMDNQKLKDAVSLYKTGKFKTVTPTFATTDNHYFTYSPADSLFGSFRTRIGVQTKDTNKSYITDYADYSLAVGYRETKEYPYTWDFTDLKKYVIAGIDEDGNEKNVVKDKDNNEVTDLRIWDAFGLRVRTEDCQDGCLFVSGSQLYADTEMFDETRGIGIIHFNNDTKRNKVMTMTSEMENEEDTEENGGLAVNDGRATADKPLFYGFVVPQVAAEQAVYVCAKKVAGAKANLAKYDIGGTEQSFTYTGTNADGFDVFAMMMPANATTADVKLCFQGYEVKKIAVSVDEKKIGSTGFATESRERIIDHTLTSYLTGKPIEAYQGKMSNDKTKVLLTPVSFLAKADAEGDLTGCILYHNATGDDKSVSVLNGGFHLFVPDMHDTDVDDLSNNTLMAHLSDANVTNTEGKISYVLSAYYYDRSEIDKEEKTYLGDGRTVGFYKVDPKTGATLAANSAYLQVNSGKNLSHIMLLFNGIGEDVTDRINTIGSADAMQPECWYTLSGLRIERPVKAGIYILNGKKVVVK